MCTGSRNTMYNLKEILTFSVLLLTYGALASVTPCYNDITATDIPQEVISPGYPNKYSPSAVCYWRIHSQDAGKVVVLETVDFLLQANDKCQYENGDYLFVADGDFNSHSRNWTLCGEDRRMITSTGRIMFVIFSSNKLYETRGFKLQYYQASAGSPCNRDLVASLVDQSFSSPGYPWGYFSNLECNYTIRTEIPGYRVEITLMDSDIEDASQCQYDRLTVIDQNNGTTQVLSTICGKTGLSTYQSSGNKLLVQFVSNGLKANKGFTIRYSSVYKKDCSIVHSQVTRLDSFIVNPGYPNNYYSNLTCDWGIHSPDANRTIEISMIKTNIAGFDPNCTGDKMEVSDMHSKVLDSVFCGNETPSFQIKYSALVSLYTDGYTEAEGFLMRYRLQKENLTLPHCGGRLNVNNSSQSLLSPLYKRTPLQNQTCKWTLAAGHSDEIIMVTLTDLDIEMATNCQFDSLEIYDASSDKDGKIIDTWCGQRGGEVIYSTGQYLTVVYKIDDSNNGRGFSLTYSTTRGRNSTQTFHMLVKNTVSYLTSPGVSNYFSQNNEFWYVFVADTGNQIKLVVTKSYLSGFSGYCTSGSKGIVYDGPTDKYPVLASINSQTFSWCGRVMPVYVSTNNHILLVYYTASLGNSNAGFELTYIQGKFKNMHGLECGGLIEATSAQKNITSPNYPRNYFNNLNCRWIIHASTNGSMIRLLGMNIVLEGKLNGNCSVDSLTLYDGTETAYNQTETWCGEMSKAYQTTGSILTVVFKTSLLTTNSGFNMQFFETTEPMPCELFLTVRHTNFHVSSPGYAENLLPANTTCKFAFARNNQYMSIHLTVIMKTLGGSSDQTCSANHINVYDGLSENSPMIGRFCGSDQKTYIGSGDHMFVKTVTGPHPVPGSFSIDFVTGANTVCGDNDLTAYLSESILTSPYYPNQYPNNLDCLWYISSNDLDYIIMIEVVKTDMDNSEGCGKDNVVVFDGYGTSSPIDRWCGTKIPKYQSTGEFLTVKFHTDSTGSKTGFKLKYWKKYHPFSLGYDSNSHVGAIVGGTIGGFFLAVFIVTFIICCVTRKGLSWRPALTTASPSYPQVTYQPGQNRAHMYGPNTASNMHSPTDNIETGESQGYIPSPTVTPSGPVENIRALPEYANLDSREGTPQHFENMQSGTHENGGTISYHNSSDNMEGGNISDQSTYM